jgi:Spy/CpxP family protein refolding chaperone
MIKMRGTHRIIVVAAVVVLSLVLTGVSFAAAPFQKERGMSHECREKEMSKALNLTAQQEQQIRELQKSNFERSKQLRAELRDKRNALGEELNKQSSDMSKVKALAADIKDIEGRLIDQRVESVIKMKEILTPEQYQKFQNTMNEKRGDWKKRRRMP